MRWVLTILGIVVVIGALAAVKGAQIGKLIGFGKQAEKDGPPPEAVGTAVAEEQDWEGTMRTVGSVASDKGVALSTDVPGVVTRIAFESGQNVKEGQVVVELDTKVERAQLATAQSRRDLAATNAERARALAKSGSISPAELDNLESALRTAGTEIEGIQAQISKKTIKAPFAGKLGIRQVNLGQYLQPGTPVTVLETTEALRIDFTLPQQRLPEVNVGMPVRVTVEGENAQPREGKIAAIDPTIDAVTRTIKLRADMAQTQGLRAGMFVRVAVVLPEKSKSVTIPATAVVHASYGDSVFVIEDKKPDAPGIRTTPDGKPVKNARQQFVKIGPARGDFVAVLDGVKAKEEVVSEGAFKLKNNSPVVIDNSQGKKPELDPHPENR